MQTKHTKGPWRVYTNDERCGIYIVHADTIISPDEDEANAKLIAAAPELLEALERILYAHDNNGNGAAMGEANLCQFYATMAREILKKAKGEA